MNVVGLVVAYDEEGTIAQVVARSLAFLPRVFVVDDGSSDETARRAERAGATVLRHASNRGKGAAIRTGLDTVLKEDATHVLFIDADLQHRPEDIPLLLEKARTGSGDFVVGERRFDRNGMPGARYYANTIGSAVMSRIVGRRIRDSQTGFRLIRAELLRSVALTSRRYEIEAEILVKLARRGVEPESVPIEATYGGARSKMRPVRDVFRICMLTMYYRYLCRL